MDLMKLADAYADASFEQGLNQRTEDPDPEKARAALAAKHAELQTQRDDLLSALHAILASECQQPAIGSAWTKALAAIARCTTQPAARWAYEMSDAMLEARK